MSDGLEFRSDFGAGQSSAPKQLWRLVDGQLVLADRPPNAIDEMAKMNGGIDPGVYFAYLSGVSDKFEEANTFSENREMRDKVVMEFTIIKSQRWGGASFQQFYTVPLNWGDDRSSLRHVVSACLGHELQDKEGFSLKRFVQEPAELIVTVESKRTQDGKRSYSKAKSVSTANVQIVDDGGPGIPAAGQTLPNLSAAPAYNDVPVAAGGVPGVDDIPF